MPAPAPCCPPTPGKHGHNDPEWDQPIRRLMSDPGDQSEAGLVLRVVWPRYRERGKPGTGGQSLGRHRLLPGLGAGRHLWFLYWKSYLGATRMIPQVPATQAKLNSHNKILSSTIATYFQSSETYERFLDKRIWQASMLGWYIYSK